MANIHLMSDLHLEHETVSLRHHRAPEGTDVVVLAGDTHPGVLGVIWAAEHFPGLPVIYVPGNHEYYGRRGFDRHLRRMQEKAAELAESMGADIRVLDRAVTEVAGVRFVCATLWTDYALFGDPDRDMEAAGRLMNDYRKITIDKPAGGRTVGLLSPSTLRLRHAEARAFIETACQDAAREHDGPLVVVTHHAPSARSVTQGFKSDEVTPCYASDLDDVVTASGADFWLHGHIHANVGYDLGATRVTSNPRGWVDSSPSRDVESFENPTFDPGLLLRLPEPALATSLTVGR